MSFVEDIALASARGRGVDSEHSGVSLALAPCNAGDLGEVDYSREKRDTRKLLNTCPPGSQDVILGEPNKRRCRVRPNSARGWLNLARIGKIGQNRAESGLPDQLVEQCFGSVSAFGQLRRSPGSPGLAARDAWRAIHRQLSRDLIIPARIRLPRATGIETRDVAQANGGRLLLFGERDKQRLRESNLVDGAPCVCGVGGAYEVCPGRRRAEVDWRHRPPRRAGGKGGRREGGVSECLREVHMCRSSSRGQATDPQRIGERGRHHVSGVLLGSR